MNLREWALPVYTILMQLGVGAMAALWVIRALFMPKYGEEEVERLTRNPVAILLITVLAAMAGSFFHLSRPLLSFLALINIGKSWLSREIVFTVLVFGFIVVLWYLQAHVDHRRHLKSFLGWASVFCGLSAVFCMTHLYLLPTQASWDTPFTVLSFYSSLVLLGTAAMITMLTVGLQYNQISALHANSAQPAIIRRILPAFTGVILLTALAILAQNHVLVQTLEAGDSTAHASLQLYLGLYQPLFIFRLVTLTVGAVWLAVAVWRTLRDKITMKDLTFHVYMACLLLLIGEILGRFLFYATHIRMGI
jgi:anaerobic dimethyl sulfoxide reductase subunit C